MAELSCLPKRTVVRYLRIIKGAIEVVMTGAAKFRWFMNEMLKCEVVFVASVYFADLVLLLFVPIPGLDALAANRTRDSMVVLITLFTWVVAPLALVPVSLAYHDCYIKTEER